jgi:transaldolase
MVIYLDGASLDEIGLYAKDAEVEGFTTNPSLLRKEGITQYKEFAHRVLSIAGSKPVSLEVLCGDHSTMERQAREIASWGENVYVKIPITDAYGASSRSLIYRLGDLKLNITAVMTHRQIEDILPVLRPHHIVSVFNGRIQDTQKIPLDVSWYPGFKKLWASTRGVGSYREAMNLGYNIITMTSDLVEKLRLHGKDLTQYSLETVKQFTKDAEGIEF